MNPSPTQSGPPAYAAATRRALCLGGGLLATLLNAPEGLAAAVPDRRDRPQADVAGLDGAIAAGDAARLEHLIHGDLLWIRGNGVTGGKADFIRALTARELTIEPFTSSRTRLFASGDLELWTGVNVLRGHAAGEAFVDRHHFADLWRRHEVGWKLVYVQVTPASETAPAEVGEAAC